MSTNFPGGLDNNTNLPNPTSGDYTNNPSHLGLHGNTQDAVKAIEAKVGIGASTPPGSNYIFTSTSTGVSSWQPAPAAGVWGLITGTLSDQLDLKAALDAKLALGGGTMTGNLILVGNPSTPNMAANKAYVDAADALKLNLTGGTLTGTLTLAADPVANLQAATKQYVDNLGTVSMVYNETPGGTVNGSNVNFTTASTYATGSLQVYLNGQRLFAGSGNDYVEVSGGFTMQYAPLTGDVLLVGYMISNTTRFIQGSNSTIEGEVPTGTVNGVTVLFTVLQAKYVANTLQVFVNGLVQSRTTDFTETSPGSGTFTFAVAPLTGDDVRVSYQFATGAAGNADTVDGFHAASTPTASTLLALASTLRFRGDALAKVQLNVSETTDFQSSGALSATTWTDFKVNQNFTVDSANSIIVVLVSVGSQVGTTSQIAFGSRIVIDSAGTPITRGIGGGNAPANGFGNPFGGAQPIIITGLSAGTHTIKTQVYSSAAATMFCRTLTVPYESYNTTILEIGG